MTCSAVMPVELHLRREHEPVTNHRVEHAHDVVRDHEATALEGRRPARRHHQVHARSRPGAEHDHRRGTRGPHQVPHVASHRLLDPHRVAEAARPPDGLARGHRRDPRGPDVDRAHPRARHGEDAVLVVGRGVAHLDLEQEAVELGFGQGVGALLLDRVLSGEDSEVLAQAVPIALDGHLPLLHGLEQGALGLGGCAVDLVGEQELGEDRSLGQAEGARLEVEDIGAEDVARHQVGRELDAPEGQTQGPR